MTLPLISGKLRNSGFTYIYNSNFQKINAFPCGKAIDGSLGKCQKLKRLAGPLNVVSCFVWALSLFSDFFFLKGPEINV
jgi:hypothetical protein